MQNSSLVSPTIHFGLFELSPQSGELRKNGMKIRLQGQPVEILVLLLQRPGEVITREELQKKLWPADTFVDFEQGLNNAIKRLRAALDDDSENPRFIETVPRRGYRFVGPITQTEPIQIPVKIAEEAVERDDNKQRSSSRRRRRILWVTLVMVAALLTLSIGFGVGGSRGRLFGKTARAPIRSLAVLPLANLSGDPQQDYFADGMTEALSVELGQIGSLRVISRTSVMQYKGTKKALPQIARELRVDALMEGSVLRVGDRVRVTAQLIGAEPERHLWAHNYERDLRDVLSLQAEIARAVADQVKANVNPDAQARLASARPVDPKAHEAYLKGQFFLHKYTGGDLQQATEYAQQAIQIDPGYASAYGLLALSSWMSSDNAYGHVPNKKAAETTRVAAMKAIAIDDTLAEPHVAVGMVLMFHDWDWAAAEGEIKRAIELNPSFALAHTQHAWYLALTGRQDESIEEAKQAVQLDPFSPVEIHSLASMYYYARHYDQALEQIRNCVDMFPTTFACYVWLARIAHAKGMYKDEVAAWQKAIALYGEKPEEVEAYRRAFEVGGVKGAWQWRIVKCKENLARHEFARFDLAIGYAFLGEKDQAFYWLEKAYEEHDDLMWLIKTTPEFDNLRSDPRFQTILRHMNFPQ